MQYQYGANVRPEMIPFLPNEYSKVLEIGSGYGAFRKNLIKQNEYWGVELNADIGKTSEKFLDKVLIGNYFDLYDQLPNDYFDLVICNDVIEHLPNPELFLNTIRKKMTVQSHLVGSIPNIRHLSVLRMLLVAKQWKYEDSGILDRTHLKFFTLSSIKQLFFETNFSVESIQGINGFTRLLNYKYPFKMLLYAILGSDIQYIQFGFRVRKNNAGTAKL